MRQKFYMKHLNGILSSTDCIMPVFILLRLYFFNLGISAKSHSGVIGKFSENVVRKEIISLDGFRVYAKLQNWRTKDDYNDLFDFTEEDVSSMMVPAKQFIDKVARLIELP